MNVEHGMCDDEQGNLYNPDTDEMRRIGNRWALAFVGLGLCALVGHVTLATGFAIAGERLTRTLRNMAFKAMVERVTRFVWPCSVSFGYVTVRVVELRFADYILSRFVLPGIML